MQRKRFSGIRATAVPRGRDRNPPKNASAIPHPAEKRERSPPREARRERQTTDVLRKNDQLLPHLCVTLWVTGATAIPRKMPKLLILLHARRARPLSPATVIPQWMQKVKKRDHCPHPRGLQSRFCCRKNDYRAVGGSGAGPNVSRRSIRTFPLRSNTRNRLTPAARLAAAASSNAALKSLTRL